MLSLVLQLAHVGHWITNVIFALPVLAFVAFLAVTAIRDRRSAAGE